MRTSLRIILISIICSQFCISCSKKSDYIIVDAFPLSIDLEISKKIKNDSVIGLLSLEKAGDYFIGELFKQEHCFQLFDQELNPIIKFARKGRGPNEYLTPTYMGQFEKENGKTNIWLLDRSLSQFMKVNIENNIAASEVICNFRASKNMRLRNLFYIDDKSLLGTIDESECKVITYDPINENLKEYDNFMSFSHAEIKDSHGLSQNMCALKPDKSRMVSVFFYLPQIDLYHNNGERYFSIFHNEILKPKEANQELEKEYYLQVCATDKFIYALMQAEQEDGKCAIQVYDWDGKPKAELFVPNATNFCVSLDDSTIYTINFNGQEDIITKFELKSII